MPCKQYAVMIHLNRPMLLASHLQLIVKIYEQQAYFPHKQWNILNPDFISAQVLFQALYFHVFR